MHSSIKSFFAALLALCLYTPAHSKSIPGFYGRKECP